MSANEPAERFDAGNLALDLLNTRPASGGPNVDELGSPAGLLAWLGSRGLTDDPSASERLRSPPEARTLLREALHLRDDVGRLVEAHLRREPVPPPVLYAVNRVLNASRISFSLHPRTHASRLVERETSPAPLALLAPVARAAALLLDTDAGRIRRCASDACSRWFVDTSKGGRRKWCSMATCGNRAKAAKHRRRRASV